MECVVSRAPGRCGGWAQDVGAAFAGGNLQSGRRTARRWPAEYADSEFESREDWVFGATGECDCADYDERGWDFLADDFLSLQLGAAICTGSGVGCDGGVLFVRCEGAVWQPR